MDKTYHARCSTNDLFCISSRILKLCRCWEKELRKDYYFFVRNFPHICEPLCSLRVQTKKLDFVHLDIYVVAPTFIFAKWSHKSLNYRFCKDGNIAWIHWLPPPPPHYACSSLPLHYLYFRCSKEGRTSQSHQLYFTPCQNAQNIISNQEKGIVS